MKTDRLLVSSTMLAALCNYNATDNLKLIEKFMMVCINDTTDVGQHINLVALAERMSERFAFKDIPSAVLEKILLRMSRGKNAYLENDGQRKFTLVKSLNKISREFELEEQNAREDIDYIVNALIQWLNSRKPYLDTSKDKVSKWLTDFFETRGIDVLFDNDELLADTIENTDILKYQISQFILNAKENDHLLFNKIQKIVEGTMLAAAIFVGNDNISRFVAMRRLTDLDVYLDTTFLLCALDLKLKEQKNAADTLLDLLRENGASLYVLPQHYYEIKDILRSFADRDAFSCQAGQTLERLEKESLTSLEVNQLIRNLEKELKQVGVQIAPKQSQLSKRDSRNEDRSAFINMCRLFDFSVQYILQQGFFPLSFIHSSEIQKCCMIQNHSPGIEYLGRQLGQHKTHR